MNSPSVDPIPTREGYDRWSKVYDGDGNPLIAVEQPVFDRLVGDPRGLRVLDVGCGTGRQALRLAARAAKVTAVDFSAGMLAQAQAKAGASRVAFHEHDVRQPLPFEPGSFDLVVSCLVLDHVHKLPTFFAELARMCRPGGRIITTVMHPAMLLRGVQARFIDPETGGRVALESAPNSIADYINASLGAGLRLEAIEEHAVGEQVAKTCPRGERYLGWPILLALALAV